MDLSQATQLLTWLDEEHRKDKALLMTMQSQVNAQQAQLKEQARQLQEIEALLARVENQLPKLAEFEGSIQDIRTEFAGLLAKHAGEHEVLDDKRMRSEQLESDALARIVHQVQERVEDLGSFEKTIALLGEEDGKLRSEITKTFAQLSEVSKLLDAQQLRLDLLQQDAQVFRDTATNAKIVHEDLNDKFMALKATAENVQSTLSTKIEQLQTFFEESNNARRTELDSLQAKHQEQARLVQELDKDMKELKTPVDRWTKQMKEFTAQFERNRKTLYELRELEKQVRQQGNEVTELQRLAAERLRTELREWQDNQIRVDEEQTAHLEQLEAWQRKAMETLKDLEDRLEQNKQDLVACTDQLRQTWTEYVQTQTNFLENIVKQRGKG